MSQLPSFSTPLIAGLGGGLAFIILIVFVTRFLYICRPNEILIFSGRQHRNPDGSESGYRVIFGGRAWRMPLIEQVIRMDMRTSPIDLPVQGDYARGAVRAHGQSITG